MHGSSCDFVSGKAWASEMLVLEATMFSCTCVACRGGIFSHWLVSSSMTVDCCCPSSCGIIKWYGSFKEAVEVCVEAGITLRCAIV